MQERQQPKRGGTYLYCPAWWKTMAGRRVTVHVCRAKFGKIRPKAYKQFFRHWRQAHAPFGHRDDGSYAQTTDV